VPPYVFDAFGWAESDTLEWRSPDAPSRYAWDTSTPIDGSDPARMVFVFRDGVFREGVPHDEMLHDGVLRDGALGPRDADGGAPRIALPHERANLHAFGLGLADDTWALAPYAIDDATDGLFEAGVRARDVFWLAADNLNALFWGLHDWVHFHNHGPFEERAWTELQCDATALAWAHLNREALLLDDATWGRMRREVEALAASRFAAEGKPFDAACLAEDRLVTLFAPRFGK
jgi:hypothetical protein